MRKETVAERAFALARGGLYTKIEHITIRLRAEGYDGDAARLDGAELRRQLREVLAGRTEVTPPKPARRFLRSRRRSVLAD